MRLHALLTWSLNSNCGSCEFRVLRPVGHTDFRYLFRTRRRISFFFSLKESTSEMFEVANFKQFCFGCKDLTTVLFREGHRIPYCLACDSRYDSLAMEKICGCPAAWLQLQRLNAPRRVSGTSNTMNSTLSTKTGL